MFKRKAVLHTYGEKSSFSLHSAVLLLLLSCSTTPGKLVPGQSEPAISVGLMTLCELSLNVKS